MSIIVIDCLSRFKCKYILIYEEEQIEMNCSKDNNKKEMKKLLKKLKKKTTIKVKDLSSKN